MATRTVLKLLTKTCPYHKTPAYSTVSGSSEKSYKSYSNKCRSLSFPACREKTILETEPKKFQHESLRSFSKSLENLRETRYVYEDEAEEVAGRSPFSVSRDRREYDEDMIDAASQRYEVSDSSREDPGRNFADVCNSMREAYAEKLTKVFPHLQPCNMQPYGSSEKAFQLGVEKRYSKIIAPAGVVSDAPDTSVLKRQYSSSSYKQQEVSALDEGLKVAICEKPSKSDHKKSYSTVCHASGARSGGGCSNKSTAMKFFKRPSNPRLGLVLKKSYARNSSCSLVNKISSTTRAPRIASKNHLHKTFSHLSARAMKSQRDSSQLAAQKMSVLKPLAKAVERSARKFCICPDPPPKKICENYITVKLGELQEQCRKSGKCKPKKINFGRLPKVVPPDCPCIEPFPLKEGKPLPRLKKVSDPKENRVLDCDIVVCDTPRADDNYKIQPKKLPTIEVKDCPCIKRELVDFKFKRLPKKKIPEPVRVCPPCVFPDCCEREVPKVERKTLPKLKVNNCPCVEPEMLKDVPLKPLVPKKVCPRKKPDCDKKFCPDAARADEGLKIIPKVLPALKSDCVCIEPPVPLDVEPLKRLRKIKFVEKRDCPEPDICPEPEFKPIARKKLPKFIPANCPCIEPEMPDKAPGLKKLCKKKEPEKPKICVEVVCDTPRADDGYKVQPKTLPTIVPGDCPCVEFVMKDCPPLKRLPPITINPVRVCPPCVFPECCDREKPKPVTPKKLPVLKPNKCPCVEPKLPEDVKPLKRLTPRPVKEPEIYCPDHNFCEDSVRADDKLKPKKKKLPKLGPGDCECVEPYDLNPGKPLARLPKADVCEPKKVCPAIDFCEEIPRSDRDDWEYWRFRNAQDEKCEPDGTNNKTGKRNYSVNHREATGKISLKYDIASLGMSQKRENSCDVVIDIKPSPPLVISQAPLKQPGSEQPTTGYRYGQPVDYVAVVIYKNNLSQTRSNLNLRSDANKSLEFSTVFNTINRFISTYNTICMHEKPKKVGKNHQTPSCECPLPTTHLQPRHPIIKPVETFLRPYPTDKDISNSAFKSTIYERERKDSGMKEDIQICREEEKPCDPKKMCQDMCEERGFCQKEINECFDDEKKLTMWEKIVNYFKARPDCPSPEEFRRMRLREDAEKAAEKAGLCLYDPKEMLKKNDELPKVITANCKADCKRS